MTFGKKKYYAYKRKPTSHLYFKCCKINMLYALILNNKNVKLFEKLNKIK